MLLSIGNHPELLLSIAFKGIVPGNVVVSLL